MVSSDLYKHSKYEPNVILLFIIYYCPMFRSLHVVHDTFLVYHHYKVHYNIRLLVFINSCEVSWPPILLSQLPMPVVFYHVSLHVSIPTCMCFGVCVSMCVRKYFRKISISNNYLHTWKSKIPAIYYFSSLKYVGKLHFMRAILRPQARHWLFHF